MNNLCIKQYCIASAAPGSLYCKGHAPENIPIKGVNDGIGMIGARDGGNISYPTAYKIVTNCLEVIIGGISVEAASSPLRTFVHNQEQLEAFKDCIAQNRTVGVRGVGYRIRKTSLDSVTFENTISEIAEVIIEIARPDQ